MGALGSGEDCRRWCGHWCCWSPPCQANRFAANDLEPGSSQMAARPVFPQYRSEREGLSKVWQRRRGIREDGLQGPKDRTHPARLDAGAAFLTLRAQGTAATMTDASGIQDAKGTIALRSALLWVEGMISRAAQRPIRLQGESGTRKASGKGRTCPLGGTILDWRWWVLSRCSFDSRSWFAGNWQRLRQGGPRFGPKPPSFDFSST